LNIHRPATKEEDLPVWVFIHGGSNRAGDIQSPYLYGANLAGQANMVVVNVQYRLNLFGWLTQQAFKISDAERYQMMMDFNPNARALWTLKTFWIPL
jgi:para-nitrobenzyl esterase